MIVNYNNYYKQINERNCYFVGTNVSCTATSVRLAGRREPKTAQTYQHYTLRRNRAHVYNEYLYRTRTGEHRTCRIRFRPISGGLFTSAIQSPRARRSTIKDLDYHSLHGRGFALVRGHAKTDTLSFEKRSGEGGGFFFFWLSQKCRFRSPHSLEFFVRNGIRVKGSRGPKTRRNNAIPPGCLSFYCMRSFSFLIYCPCF